MINIEIVLEAARRRINASKRQGAIGRSGHVAAQLLEKYPDCAMSPAELSKAIFELASAKGVAVEFGD
jgi:hypothetical protein